MVGGGGSIPRVEQATAPPVCLSQHLPDDCSAVLICLPLWSVLSVVVAAIHGPAKATMQPRPRLLAMCP